MTEQQILEAFDLTASSLEGIVARIEAIERLFLRMIKMDEYLLDHVTKSLAGE